MDKRIGAQLYTIRDFCQNEADFDESMKKLSQIGYKTVQVSGVGDIAPEKIKEILDKYSIEPVCTHRSYDEYLNNIDYTADYHKALGCDICGLGYLPFDKMASQLDEHVANLNRINEALKKCGLNFAYHNHAAEFGKVKGKYIYDIFAEETDMDFIVDVYWLAYAAQDPAKVIEKLGNRAKIVHFKDYAINDKGTVEMAEIYEGNLNFDEIISACESAGTLAAFVEQDICKGDPFDSLKISYDNLTKKGFV